MGDSQAERVARGLEGVEVEVVNAVAPFDHHSNVDSMLLMFQTAELWEAGMRACQQARGIAPAASSEGDRQLPERDSPNLMASLDFPHVERLASEGLPYRTEPVREGDLDPPPLPAGYRAVSEECWEELRQTDGPHRPSVLLNDLRGAWHAVLTEIDADAAVRALVDEFSACAREAGIPADNARNERGFLGYVTGQWQRAESEEAAVEVGERYGKLYAECGRELFETRERLRAGERREAFLREHADAIRELNDLLYGDG